MYNWIYFRYMSLQGNSMPTAPTMQMRPRSRHRLSACCAGAAEVTVGHLRCEYRENPLGIDAAAPRLEWKIEKK